MGEVPIGFPWDDQYIPMADQNISLHGFVPDFLEAENPLLPKRNGDDRALPVQVLGVVPVWTYVVTLFSVVPIEQEAIEAGINVLLSPFEEGHHFRGDGEGDIAGPGVVVALAIGLLPAGSLDFPTPHFDGVVFGRMLVPKRVKVLGRQ